MCQLTRLISTMQGRLADGANHIETATRVIWTIGKRVSSQLVCETRPGQCWHGVRTRAPKKGKREENKKKIETRRAGEGAAQIADIGFCVHTYMYWYPYYY